MENVILVIHLILALALIGIVLLQRSEGGGLGIGGGGGVMSSRGAATALGKLTWAFAIAFLATSITLTILSARNAADSSVIETLGIDVPAADTTPATPDLTLPSGTDLTGGTDGATPETLDPPRAD